MLIRRLLSAFLIVSLCDGCHKPSAEIHNGSSPQPLHGSSAVSGQAKIHFEEIAETAGVAFTYRNDEESGRFAIIESMGGGVGVFDFDRDSRLDIWLPGGGHYSGARQIEGRPTGLFRADGDGQRYQNVAEAAQVSLSRYYSYGVAISDFDQDGFEDVLMTGYGGVQFFHNQGDGTFEELAATAGLNDSLWSVSAAWGDLNGDHEPDLYLTHYVNWSFDNDPICTARPPEPRDVCPPRRFDPLPDTVYFSNGNGTFRDATADTGLRSDGKGLGVVLTDIDGDNQIDLYVANDTDMNFLYRNARGHFVDLSVASGAGLNERGLPDGSMGTAVIDFDGNGLPDLLVSNYEGEDPALYQNLGQFTFRHVSRIQGMSSAGKTFVGWGIAVFDAELDGDDDVMISNGHAIRFPGEAGLAQRALFYENREGRLVNVADSVGNYFVEKHRGRGLAMGDLDRDGRMDVISSAVNEPVSVLQNASMTSGSSLSVRLVGRISPRDGTGAIVSWQDGSVRQVRWIAGGGSYASASDKTLLFARPQASMGGRLEIRWPHGQTQIEEVDSTLREIVIVESIPSES